MREKNRKEIDNSYMMDKDDKIKDSKKCVRHSKFPPSFALGQGKKTSSFIKEEKYEM